MFGFLKNRVFLTVLGLLLLAVVIWVFGPLLFLHNPFAGPDEPPMVPLGDTTGKLIAIGIVLVVWAAAVLIKRLRANQASDQLVAAVVKQSQSGKEPPSAEAVQLRERFEEAVATLKQKRRSGHSLYDLPWYVIIGAPGSGKTTALVNSGLNFPLEQRTGKGALRGVGGTRNCDWWFTDEAVLLDTAGRYTTQDSDAASDSAGWVEFLALLRKYRRRRPLNGVILTISAQDLLTQGSGGQEAHVLAVRRRLNELNKELKIQLPVYLMVTKCDLVAGFTEYFDDLAQDGRAQVWGVTFPYQQTVKGGAAEACPAEFDALIARLNERLFARLEDERDVRRRTKIFAFPQQMEAMKDALAGFVSEVFGATRFDERILFRGMYFTSGTQVGNPIDRLLGAIGRRFAIAPDVAAPAGGKGRAYFIQRLLKDVLFAESGLAGVDRRTEALKATAQVGAYVGIAVIVGLALLAWSVSYRGNETYLGGVAAALSRVRDAPATDGSLESVIARLDAVRAVMDAANPDSSWTTHWGLHQAGWIGSIAADAYGRSLRTALLPLVSERLRQRLVNHTGKPEELYEYLKAYLMLTDPSHLKKDQDKENLANITNREWVSISPESATALSKHFRFLLDRLPASPQDGEAVDRARKIVLGASLQGLVYLYLLDYKSDHSRDLKLDQFAGLEKVLRRKSGSFSTPVPSPFTKPVFDEIATTDMDTRVKEFKDEVWVWGDSRPRSMTNSALRAAVLELYENAYIATWHGVLNDLESAPRDLQQNKAAMQILAAPGPGSPVRAFFKVVDDNTFFTRAADPAQSVADQAASRLNKVLGGAAPAPTTYPGARITQEFAAIHALVAGPQPLMEIILAKAEDLNQKLQPIGTSVGGTDPGSVQAIRSVTDSANGLKAEVGRLPAGVGSLGQALIQIADGAVDGVTGGARSILESRYQDQVVTPCKEIGTDKYPFTRSSNDDMPLMDFGRLFGYGGVFDTFSNGVLKDYVIRDPTTHSFAWRPDGASAGRSTAILRQFDVAQQIQGIFFKRGSQDPELRFTVTDVPYLDELTDKFTLDVDGQSAWNRHGAFQSQTWNWPGPRPGKVVITFEPLSGERSSIEIQGPWAWLRLMESNRIQIKSAGIYELTVTKDTHAARVTVDAKTTSNPYGKTDWQNFRCQ